MSADLCAGDDVLTPTAHRIVELDDDARCSDTIVWWTALTDEDGAGMVVKPWDFAARKGNAILQPAVKCRGREYPRIIYGPECTADGNLSRLRSATSDRSVHSPARSSRWASKPWRDSSRASSCRASTKCVFAVLAMESEPVDPWL